MFRGQQCGTAPIRVVRCQRVNKKGLLLPQKHRVFKKSLLSSVIRDKYRHLSPSQFDTTLSQFYPPAFLNPLPPNDPYNGRTAPLICNRCILYIYSTNTGTEYFKHGIYSPYLSSSKCSLFHNSNVFGFCIIHILYTGCFKIKK